MSKLTLDLFTSGYQDVEAKQYQVLQGLKEQYDRFSHNRLYPDLADLIRLAGALEAIIESHEDLQQRLPRTITDLDIEQKKVVTQPSEMEFPELSRVIDFIAWALPLIRKAIEEGTTIYNFVDQHIAIEEVGILPVYREEGYWFIPDLKAELLHLLRYELSLFSASNERYRTLKTVFLESLEEHAVKLSPESVKLSLMKKYHDLPNPATYRCEVDIDFPYQDTVLPVAKRKLMAHLVA
jgi:hypothetical protein